MLQAIKDSPALRRWYHTFNAPVKLSRFKVDLGLAVRTNSASLALVPLSLDDEVYEASMFHSLIIN
jgi:hypothetical protein